MRLYLPIAALLLFCLPASASHAEETCPFLSPRQLVAATNNQTWTLISNQDGRGCIFLNDAGDTLMLSVHRNPSAERAKELYETFRKTLAQTMTLTEVPGIGEQTHAGAARAVEAKAEAAVLTLTGDYIVQIHLRETGPLTNPGILAPLAAFAVQAIKNTGKSSERFGSCEWLTVEDAAGFLDESTLTLQRTGANSCMIYDSAANTLMVSVTAVAPQTVMNMKNRSSGCQHEPLPEFGKEAFGEHSCKSGNTNAANIHVWKGGREAWIVFAPRKPHPESGTVKRLKEVAARVYAKL
jgi:hypothetical protein